MSRLLFDDLLEFQLEDLQIVLERSGLHESPAQRLPAAKLLLHSVFKNPYGRCFSFLSDYVLKTDEERKSFFEYVKFILISFPSQGNFLSWLPRSQKNYFVQALYHCSFHHPYLQIFLQNQLFKDCYARLKVILFVQLSYLFHGR